MGKSQETKKGTKKKPLKTMKEKKQAKREKKNEKEHPETLRYTGLAALYGSTGQRAWE